MTINCDDVKSRKRNIFLFFFNESLWLKKNWSSLIENGFHCSFIGVFNRSSHISRMKFTRIMNERTETITCFLIANEDTENLRLIYYFYFIFLFWVSASVSILNNFLFYPILMVFFFLEQLFFSPFLDTENTLNTTKKLCKSENFYFFISEHFDWSFAFSLSIVFGISSQTITFNWQ